MAGIDKTYVTWEEYQEIDLNRINRYISLLPDYIKIKY